MSDSFDDRGDFAPDTTSISSEINAVSAVSEPNAFETLGLAGELVRAVADLGFTQPTQVQATVIPKALRKEHEADERYADLMVSSQTGSGKTAAFLLPVLHTLIQQQAAKADAERLAFERETAEALAA